MNVSLYINEEFITVTHILVLDVFLCFFLALQGSDPNWYTALINVLDGEQTRALQDVFVQAEQRKNALGESRGLFQQILSFTCSILTYSRKTV